MPFLLCSLTTCYLPAQVHILNSICGRKGGDLELDPLKDSPHYDELNSMLHARVAVAGLRGAVDQWLAGEKGALQKHLSAIKAPGAKLRKVVIDLNFVLGEGCLSEDAANEIMLAIMQPSLVELRFTNCEALKKLPEAIGDCTSLKELHLCGCSGLTTLPAAVGNCSSLTELNLSNCKGITALPEAIGNCTSLTGLELTCSSGLMALPEAIGNCTSLATLELTECSGLTALPEAIGNCSSLTTLRLAFCSGLTALPEAIGNSTSLTTLDLIESNSLKAAGYQSFWRRTKLGAQRTHS